MPFESRVAGALRQLIRTERNLFRGDAAARQTARAMNRRILYEVAPRKDGSIGQVDDSATALAILDQTSNYLRRNIVRATMNQKGSWEVELTKDTELGDNESINNPMPMSRGGSRARCSPAASAPSVGSLKPSMSLRQSDTSLAPGSPYAREGPVRELTPEEVQQVENYLHGRDDSSPPPMELLKAYQHRLEALTELSGATAALINPPLSAKYHTGFVRPWDEYQAEIDVAKGQSFKPFSPIPAFFIAAVTSFTVFYFFYPHLSSSVSADGLYLTFEQFLRNFTRMYELSASR